MPDPKPVQVVSDEEEAESPGTIAARVAELAARYPGLEVHQVRDEAASVTVLKVRNP